MLRLAGTRDEVGVVADQHGNPTWSRDVATTCLRLGDRLCAGVRDAHGVFHAVGEGDTTCAEFAQAVFDESARRGGLTARVRPITTADHPCPQSAPQTRGWIAQKLERVSGWRPPLWRENLASVIHQLTPG